jgi:hypothetical protein
MYKLMITAGMLALTTPAFSADWYIVQNPRTRVCTVTEERPAPSASVVIGTPFGVRVEAESRMKTVKECGTETTGRGGVIEEHREERPR